MNQDIINLYDEYTHRPLTRSEFLRRLIIITGSTAAALAVLPMIEVNHAHAAVTSADELFTEYISYPGVNGTMQAYVARPKELKKYPVVVVIHENRGLNAHIEDVARRAALAGYLAVAPNALAPIGGTPANEDEARTKFQQLKGEDSLQNFLNAFDYIATRSDAGSRVGCVGFCWGGLMSNNLAFHKAKNLKAAVAFYGRQPALDKVEKIDTAIQLHYGGLDEGVNKGKDAYEEALKKAGVVYEQYVYENVNHAFHNDTAPARYNEAAAKLAWERTLKFFGKYIGA